MTAASKRSRRPTVHRGVELRCGMRFDMGYASEEHRHALRRLGPSTIHRLSFHGTEAWLFS